MIGIIDYGMGNVRSVANALAYLGHDSIITHEAARLAECERLILPGVGAFGDAMEQLRARNLPSVLHREVIEGGKAILGICLGMQLMATKSYEHGEHEGLGWFDAEVVRIDDSAPGVVVPHMGWNAVSAAREHPVLASLPTSPDFYFVHSFHVRCSFADDVVARTNHGGSLAVVIARGNVCGVQFHPEKSQDNGLQVLTNFIEWQPASTIVGAAR